ncbi:MAG: hypothetical protein RIB59_02045 [Rhodospirillales bacterium]
MATPVVGTAQVTSPAPLPPNRSAAPTPGAPSSEGQSVEAISPQIAVTPRDSNSGFQDFEQGFSNRRRQAPPLLSNPGRLDAPSETFASIIQEQEEEQNYAEQASAARLKGLSGELIKKAIGVYEENIRLISGERVERGSTVRLTL